ncbi:nectin-3-like protein isoform X2 [Syngnathoides biaculeatus]|uniref:nectin-3-like protein isoform X2 n=1 Tax=Syngnathoides biaculeatus TaxID=300417 RepID=UPI002ADE75CA|nr:nectin-3-like protein isoform X2 [Syngnathoides biaculeatus]
MSPTPWQTSRGKVAFFHLCCCISGLWAIRVVAPPSVSPVLGQRQTLECRLDAGADFTLAQSSWERRLPNGSAIVAVYNPTYGVSVPPEFVHRLHFRSPSSRDSAIVLEKVGFADEGVYTCKVSTYPLGNAQASVTVRVLAEPKVYVSTGTTPLMDGGNETTVATCVAERARPPAAVSWESNLLGRSEVQLFDVDGTATTIVRYLWRPTRSVWRHSLTCVVRHPTLTDDVRLPYRLDVQFAPEISVAGYDGEWNVGRGDVRLTCRAYANPPAHRFRWSRIRKMALLYNNNQFQTVGWTATCRKACKSSTASSFSRVRSRRTTPAFTGARSPTPWTSAVGTSAFSSEILPRWPPPLLLPSAPPPWTISCTSIRARPPSKRSPRVTWPPRWAWPPSCCCCARAACGTCANGEGSAANSRKPSASGRTSTPLTLPPTAPVAVGTGTQRSGATPSWSAAAPTTEPKATPGP